MATANTPARERRPDSGKVEAAMNRVLAAEEQAQLTLERCRAEAEELIAAADAKASRISARTEERLKAAHRIADAMIERTLAALENGEATPDADERVRGRLEAAIAALADEIVGVAR